MREFHCGNYHTWAVVYRRLPTDDGDYPLADMDYQLLG